MNINCHIDSHNNNRLKLQYCFYSGFKCVAPFIRMNQSPSKRGNSFCPAFSRTLAQAGMMSVHSSIDSVYLNRLSIESKDTICHSKRLHLLPANNCINVAGKLVAAIRRAALIYTNPKRRLHIPLIDVHKHSEHTNKKARQKLYSTIPGLILKGREWFRRRAADRYWMFLI